MWHAPRAWWLSTNPYAPRRIPPQPSIRSETLGTVSLRFCCSVSALIPIASHPKFVLRGIFFELNGRWDSGGFPLREETGGILVPIQNAWWSRTLYYLFSVRDYGVHPRHSPRTFPLGLLAPRCLGLARFLALPHCGAGARAPAVWGREGILPPASPRLGRARPTGSANPHPRFHIRVFLKIIFFSLLISSALIRESGRPSGNVRGSNANALDPVRLITDGLSHPFARISTLPLLN